MKILPKIILAILALTLALIVLMPAAFIATQAKQKISELDFYGVSGTLWQGQINQLHFKQWRLENIQWHLEPLHLLKGQLGFQIELQDKKGTHFNGLCGINISSQRYCSQSTAKLKAEHIKDYVPSLFLISLSGDIHITLDELILQDNQAIPQRIDGNLRWKQAHLQSPFDLQLEKDLTLKVNTDDQGILTGKINTQSKDILHINAQLSLNPDNKKYTADGQLSIRNNTPEAIKNNPILFTLDKNPDGSHHFKFEGSLP